MTNENIIDEAEAFLAATSQEMIGPLPGECLLCYLARMLEQWGCRGHRFVEHYRALAAPRATALRERLSRMGACCCDCEVFLNVYELRPEFDDDFDADWDDDADDEDDERDLLASRPPCGGVRRGSTQPCELWQRQYRPRYW